MKNETTVVRRSEREVVITRTFNAVARPFEPGVRSAPGSDTSIQNRHVSRKRRSALSPA